MDISDLDLFILNLVRGGLATPYDLKMKAGLSVGSTVPILDRLESNRLIVGSEVGSRGSRRFSITRAGREALQREATRVTKAQPIDTDAILRAAHLSAAFNTASKTAEFLESSAERLRAAAVVRLAETQVDMSARSLSGGPGYRWLKSKCEAARLKAQAEVLVEVSKIERQRSKRK